MNRAQEHALADIVQALTAAEGAAPVRVLEGVTASGKTEVYLRAIEAALERGRGAILLVPEIALTPQTRARVVARFGSRVAVLHSNLGLRERWKEWHRIANGDVRIVVGTRSALFAPVRDLGLIVIDEEQEGAYKQSRMPRYHAREVAMKRAALCGGALVLGTATPTPEAKHMVEKGAAGRLHLPDRVGEAGPSQVTVVDMRKRAGGSILSDDLAAALDQAFDRSEKAILLINRRGFANFLLCSDCGHVPLCRHCAVSLTYHKKEERLRCHHCNFSEAAPAVCPACGGFKVLRRGAGTQRAEEEITARFPGVSIVRMDADSTTRKGAHDRHLSAFAAMPSAGILLGTQMIAKGLHFPEVTVVGVLSADSGLYLPDFRAAERSYSLVTQVAGRAGRGDRPGRVFIQTYNPEHFAISAAAEGRPEDFYAEELAIRKAAAYPPFVGMTSVVVSHFDPRRAEGAARRLVEALGGALASTAASGGGTAPSGVASPPYEILGPSAAPIERIKGRYRWHFLLKYPADHEMLELKDALHRAARSLSGDKNLNVVIDVDPAWVL